jgi:hypothetical protein
VVQDKGPNFKPQYQKKEKKKTTLGLGYSTSEAITQN